MTARKRITLVICAGLIAGASAFRAPANAGLPDPYQDTTARSIAHLPLVDVARGDTLTAIAAHVGRSWWALAAYNTLSEPNHITAGTLLAIPPAGYTPPPMPKPQPGPTDPPLTVRTITVAVSTAGWTPPWACIAHYESGGNPAENTGNGYEGGLQFAPSTWAKWAPQAGVNVAHAYQATISQQEAVANLVLAHSSWRQQWPVTSHECGYS